MKNLALKITCLIILACGITSLPATDYFWDADGSGSGTCGAAGPWDTTSLFWSDAPCTGTYSTWPNANTHTATFTGSASYTMTPAVNIVLNKMTNSLTGGTLTIAPGVGTQITFSGATPTLHADRKTTFTVPIKGTSTTLIKTGAGQMQLNNNGQSIPKYVIKAGIITTANTNKWTGTGQGVADALTLDGGGWGIDSTTQNPSFFGITIGPNGGSFGMTATTISINFYNRITGASSGGINFGGPVMANTGSTAYNGAGGYRLFNTANDYAGNTTVTVGNLTNGAAGVIPDTSVVVMAGGTWKLEGNNETVKSVSGSSAITVGTATLTLDDPAGETFSSTFAGSSGGKIIKNGSGALSLAGNSSGWLGEWIINSGRIGVGHTGAFGKTAGSSTLTLNGGGLANVDATGRTINANVAVNVAGDFSFDDSIFTTAANGNIAFGGPATLQNGNRTITANNLNGYAGALIFTGAVGEDAAGRGIIKNGNGSVTLGNAANTYSGDTTINAGQINVDADGTLGNGAGTLYLSGGNLNITASRTATIPNPIAITADSAITCSSFAATVDSDFTTGTLTPTAATTLTFSNNAASGTGVFKPRLSGGGFTYAEKIAIQNGAFGTTELSSFNTTGADQTFSGLISGTGSYRRSASTGGTGGNTTFTAANTFSGGSSIGDGGIGLGIDSAGTPPSITSGPIGTGALTVSPVPSGSPNIFASGGARTLGNAITLDGTLGVTGANNLALAGNITGAGGLTMGGGGILTLSGANSYGGVTTVSSGTLDAAAAGTLGAGDVIVASGATLKLGAVGAIASSSSLVLASGTPQVNLNFAGTSIIAGLSFDGGATFATYGTYGATGSGATYINDTVFSGPGQLQVTVIASSTALITSGTPSGYGDTVTFTATVTGAGATPTGTVTFKDGAATIGSDTLDGSGVATLDISSLAAGVHSITAVYGGDSGYLASTSSAVSQTVTQAVLTVTATGLLTYGDDPASAVYTPNYSGFQNGENSSVVTGSATFGTDATSTSYVGDNYLAQVLTLGTLTADNYSFAAGPDGVLTVTNRPLTVTGALAANKDYDGTTSATLDTTAAALNNFVSGDETSVTLDATGATGAFADKHVGLAKAVNCSGFATSGDLGTNYYVTQPVLSADINQTNITVTAQTNTKPYDGNTSAAAVPLVTAGAIQTADAAGFTETYDTADVGTGKTLTAAGSVTDGNGGANYNVTFVPDTTGVISAVSSSTALISSLNPSLSGENVTFTATVSSGVGTPTGSVVFKTNGVTLATVPLVAGVASTSTTDLPVGTHSVAAEYASQANWLGSSDGLSQVVNSAVVCSATNAILSIVNLGGGSFTLNFQGTEGAEYYVVTSSSLTAAMGSWTPVVGSTNTAGVGGLWTATVSGAAPAYYRGVAVNPCP